MDELKNALKPLTDQLPSAAQEFLEAGGWWLVLGLAVLLVLLVLLLLLRTLRRLFRRRPPPEDFSDRLLYENLAECPLPTQPPGERRLTVYHLPVRLRLVVVAPAGTEVEIDATQIEKLLDLVVPGLGAIALHDRPRIRAWPGQLSQHGFTAAFFRRVQRPEPEGMSSRWVLVAGKATLGRLPVLLGLGLWADEPNAVGRLTLEPHQWLDVLRLRTGED